MNESTLPRWAQTLLANQRRRIAELEAALGFAVDAPPSPILADPYTDSARYLSADAQVRFLMDGPDEPRVFIDASWDDGTVRVQGSHPLAIEPIVTNHLVLRLRDRS